VRGAPGASALCTGLRGPHEATGRARAARPSLARSTPPTRPYLPPPLPAPLDPTRLSPLLDTLPLWLASGLSRGGRFLGACLALLPQFVAPPLPEALRRCGLVLGVSLAMVVVVSSIDSAWLYLYLLRARHVAA
jgi:hypothetical protein